MLVRAAVAGFSQLESKYIGKLLVDSSIYSTPDNNSKKSYKLNEFEIDVGYYLDNFSLVLEKINQIDILFVSYYLLQENRKKLLDLYHANTNCMIIPIGSPREMICEFLELRPAGHILDTARSSHNMDTVLMLCNQCVGELAENNSVLQLTTKRGSYAISMESIIFCQSDQKYVIICCDDGKVFRKLGKLDSMDEILPDYFVRIHKSFFINWKKVIGLDKSSWEILLNDGNKVRVSKPYQKEISNRIENYHLESQK